MHHSTITMTASLLSARCTFFSSHFILLFYFLVEKENLIDFIDYDWLISSHYFTTWQFGRIFMCMNEIYRPLKCVHPKFLTCFQFWGFIRFLLLTEVRVLSNQWNVNFVMLNFVWWMNFWILKWLQEGVIILVIKLYEISGSFCSKSIILTKKTRNNRFQHPI